ncbi:hypothetical protein [Hymenobacter sp. UYCo722]|uniref:hypothetical protein n=1 Tax=Hymenobacter sp. UYCo722 TaxID=3156335 RepID=UPI0033974B7B
MKNHFSSVAKLVAVAACALSLGSCSRAEYAMLPKGASYHGVARAATPVPAAAPASEVVSNVAATPAETTSAPVVATVPAQPAAVMAPAAKAATVAVAPAASATAPAAAATTAPAPKLNLVQRMAMSKLTHKMDKLIQKSGAVRQHDNTASTARGSISGNLRIGIILLLIGLLVGIINGYIGAIIAIIGLIFIVLWLLDQV